MDKLGDHMMVNQLPRPVTKTTWVWEVFSGNGDVLLGRVAWRISQYVFEPVGSPYLSSSSLGALKKFIDNATKSRRSDIDSGYADARLSEAANGSVS